MLYQKIIRPILFKFDPETIHNIVMKGLAITSRIPIIFHILRKFCLVSDPILETKIGELKLKNPIGLAAGLDKNLDAPRAYEMLGFGFAELGSVTCKAQQGNPKPRLWRLVKDKSLLVYYGLCNNGCLKAKEKLKRLSRKKKYSPIGVSLAPGSGLDYADMVNDYAKGFLKLHQYVDFITLNLSCPNVAGFNQTVRLDFLEDVLQKISRVKRGCRCRKDIFVKIGPDMSKKELSKVVELCVYYGVRGIIATNLVKDRDGLDIKSSMEISRNPGGISGKLLWDKSNETLKYLYQKSNGSLDLIGLGGVFTAKDAYEKIKLGAVAVQMVTGFIYGGPFSVRKINRELAELLKKDGYKKLSEAVGRGVEK